MVNSVGPEDNPFEALGKPPEKSLYDGYTVSSTYITMRDDVKIAANLPPKRIRIRRENTYIIISNKVLEGYGASNTFQVDF